MQNQNPLREKTLVQQIYDETLLALEQDELFDANSITELKSLVSNLRFDSVEAITQALIVSSNGANNETD